MFNFFKKDIPNYSDPFNTLNIYQKESIASLLLVLAGCDQKITNGINEEEFAFVNKQIESFNLKKEFTILQTFGIDGVLQYLSKLSESQKDHLIILVYDLLSSDMNPNEIEIQDMLKIFSEINIFPERVLDTLKKENKEINENLFKIESQSNNNDFNEDKFFISSIFYQFCFSKEIASLLLGKNNEIAKTMANTQYEYEAISLLLFKAYLTKYEVDFDYQKNGEFKYKSFRFSMNVERMVIGNDDKYFEILYNNIKNVQNEDGFDLAVATHFVICVENYLPSSLFVIVFDPILEKFAIRQVYNDGVSSKIAFIDNNELDTFTPIILKKLETQ